LTEIYCCNCIYYKGIHDEGINDDECYCPGKITSTQEEFDESPVNPPRIRTIRTSGDANKINANNDCDGFIDKNTRKGRKLRKKVTLYFKYWDVKIKPSLTE